MATDSSHERRAEKKEKIEKDEDDDVKEEDQEKDEDEDHEEEDDIDKENPEEADIRDMRHKLEKPSLWIRVNFWYSSAPPTWALYIFTIIPSILCIKQRWGGKQ